MRVTLSLILKLPTSHSIAKEDSIRIIKSRRGIFAPVIQMMTIFCHLITATT